MTVHRDWDQAVDLVIEGLRPLGDEYRDVLAGGLRGRWCDRYENKGKRSGAFSSGCYDSDPYILMNYRPDVLDHVYTLAHEAGHSMHSWHSNQDAAVSVCRLHDLRRRGRQHGQRATADPAPAGRTRSPTASGPII